MQGIGDSPHRGRDDRLPIHEVAEQVVEVSEVFQKECGGALSDVAGYSDP